MSGEHKETGEQSWIMLEDGGNWTQGQLAARVPPTEGEEGEEAASHRLPRVGMDRDVRDALEQAERSLQQAALDKLHRDNSDDDASTVRSSPIIKSFGPGGTYWDEADTEGGAPRLEREHIAFQSLGIVRSDTPIPSTVTISNPSGGSATSSPKTILGRGIVGKGFEGTPDEDDMFKREDEQSGSLFSWILGIPAHPNFVPLVFSHVMTLLVGFYIGTRRATLHTSSTPSNTNQVTPGTQQCLSSPGA